MDTPNNGLTTFEYLLSNQNPIFPCIPYGKPKMRFAFQNAKNVKVETALQAGHLNYNR